MITQWDVYWITRLDGIGQLCTLVCIVGLLSLVGWGLAMLIGDLWDEHKERRPQYLRCLYVMLAASVASLVVGTFVPSTKEAVAIYMIPKIVNNEQVQKMPDNAMKFLNGKFEAWIDDMTKERKKK